MIRAALYARVSTDRQAKEGDSIPAQMSALRKYAAEHDDVTIAGEYIDDGVSGRKIDRDELQRLLDDVRSGKIDVIIFTKLDRWFRSIRHYINTQELLDRHKVGWLAIWEPIYDTTTPAGRLIVNQMLSIAQFEAENTGARIRQVMDYKAQRGEAVSGKVPYGYKIADKRLVIVPERAEIVKAIFEVYAKTGSIADATREAERHGLTRTALSIKKMLQQEKYAGIYTTNAGVVVNDYCPQIVPDDIYTAAQNQLRAGSRSDAKTIYIFSGLLVCAECGRRFRGGRSHAKTPTYKCPIHDMYKRCPNANAIREKDIEKFLLDSIRETANKADIRLVETPKANKRKDTRQSEKERLKRRLERLKDLYLSELMTLDEYKQEKEKIVSSLEAIEETQPDDPGEKQPGAQFLAYFTANGWEKTYHVLTPQEKRLLWRSIVREITISKDRILTVEYL